MDHFIINAKPQPYDVIPYHVAVRSNLSTLSSLNPYINVIGRSFLKVRNVYLSGSNVNILNNVTYHNPFSAVANLSADNLGFYGVKLNDYVVEQTKYITFDTTGLFHASGYVDVIVENEAGYGTLSISSRVPFISSYNGAIDSQRPCVSGIFISYIND